MGPRGPVAALGALAAACALAAPAHGAAFWVNTTADSATVGCPNVSINDLPVADDPATTDVDEAAQSTCSLRSAMQLTNVTPGADDPDFIGFNVGGPFLVGSPLPTLLGGTYIEGECCSGAPGMRDVIGGALGQGLAAPAFVLEGTQNNIAGLAIHGFTDGIVLGGAGQHNIEGGYVGLNGDGTTPTVPNSGVGLRVLAGSAGNLIGEVQYPRPVVVSGNGGYGIVLEDGSGPTDLRAARVGLTPTEDGAAPNGSGGILVRSDGDAIGSADSCTNGNPPILCSRVYASGNGGPGIVLAPTSSGSRIVNTFVGVDGDTTLAIPNAGDGIVASGSGHVIGRSAANSSVVASGNSGRGIVLRGTQIQLRNARVGTSTSGDVAVPNAQGGVLTSAEEAPAGGHTIAQNVVSGNTGPGLELQQSGATITGNAIGVGADRTTPLGNSGDGIRALRGPQTIGGFGSAVNVVRGNGGAGLAVVSGLPGVVPRGVRINHGGEFALNGGLGIDLGGDGLTASDAGDVDDGPNGLINTPVLTSVSSADGRNAFRGTFESSPDTRYDFDLYRSEACDPSGSGEGEFYLGGGNATTGADGKAFFGFVATGQQYQPGDVLTVIATSPDGDTSEFSPCLVSVAGVDLAVTQRLAETAPLTTGQTVELITTITNAGPSTATNVTLQQSIPSGMSVVASPPGCEDPVDGRRRCGLENLAAGQSVERRFLLRAATAGTQASVLTIGADELDTNTADNTSSLDIPVTGTPVPGAPVPGTPIDAPRPVFASLLRVDPVTGTVTATLPGGRPITLSQFALVPVGTVVDATNGIAQITSERPDGTIQSGTFRDAAFRVRQPVAEDGLTEARIVSPLDCGGAATTSRAAAKKKKRPKNRKLWGTVKGRFRIRGRHGTGAVRGTKWRVVDTCTTTEVFVREGVVVASPLGAAQPGERVLRAGQRVLFRKR